MVALVVIGAVAAGTLSFGTRSYSPSSHAALERHVLTTADLPRGWRPLPPLSFQIPGEKSAPCVSSATLANGSPAVTTTWIHYSRHGGETLWEAVGSTPLATPADVMAAQRESRRDEIACVAIENAKLSAEHASTCPPTRPTGCAFVSSLTIEVAPVARPDSAPAIHTSGLVDDGMTSLDPGRAYSYTFVYGYTLVNVVVTVWGTARPSLNLIRRAAQFAR